MKTLTATALRHAITTTLDDIVRDLAAAPETDRETVIERLDEENDTLFGQLVYLGRIDQYGVSELIATAQPCTVILQVATEDAWVEDDRGLWDGLTYGVLASIAFFSLRNCLYAGLKARGYDTNEDQPFATKATV